MTDLSSFRPYRVELLLQAGVDINSGDGAESDNKVLHWAASFANLSTLKLVLGNYALFSPTVYIGKSSCLTELFAYYLCWNLVSANCLMQSQGRRDENARSGPTDIGKLKNPPAKVSNKLLH